MIQPFNPQIDQQVSQYQQTSAFNQPGPRQVMAPRDRQFAEDQQDDNFMMGMAQIGSQERTWANKNQLDFQNAENQRSFESAENEKQRTFMDNMRREEIERDNQRAQKLSQAMSERARLRLEAMKKSGAESMALLEEERALGERHRQHEAAMLKANIEYGRELGQDVQTPIRNQIANLDGQIRTVQSMQQLLSSEGSAANALLESNVIARLRNFAYTTPTRDPGWFTNAEELKPSGSPITPYLDDYGTSPVGEARTIDTELSEGVTIGGMERMVKDISDTITRTVGGPGVGLKDPTAFSKGISRLVLASTLNTRGELGDVQSDVKEITDDLMRQGVSPHIIPVVLGHLEQTLTQSLLQEREAIQGMYPTANLFDSNSTDYNTISMGELSLREIDGDLNEGRDVRYRYNALATAVNGLRRARGRVEASGLALGVDELVGQKTMYESAIQDFSGYDEDNMFEKLSSDGVSGTLSRENFASMLANRGLMDVIDMNPFDGDTTDRSRLRPAEQELLDYITRFEGIRRDAKSKSRDFKKEGRELERANEDLRIKRAQGQQAQQIDLAEELAALGLPDGLGLQEMMMLFGGLDG